MYGKIFEQMYDSSLVEDWKVLVTFQQLIVLADADGIVDMTATSIARRTNIPLDVIEYGIAELEKPDPSRDFSRAEARDWSPCRTLGASRSRVSWEASPALIGLLCVR